MAAMELDRGFSDRTGEYIVTFHAIEFGLKAFLIKCGVPEWGLREKPYGHDLVCLYNMAKQRGLSLGITDVDEMLAWINEWHHCGVKIRYEFTEQLCQFARLSLLWRKPSSKRATRTMP
jgi:hypothetical protein